MQLDPYDTYEFNGDLICGDCHYVANKNQELSYEEIRLKIIEGRDKKQQNFSDFIMVSVPKIEGKKIEKYFNMITSELVIGTGMFSEIEASVIDMFGSTGAYSNKFQNLKKQVYNGLINQAVSLGANAVVGADAEYMNIGHNMIMFSVSGTPVVVKDINMGEFFQENEK